ncbi:MAG: hypothetical protein ACREXX_19450 [Gammaproteobacteria bacterium]
MARMESDNGAVAKIADQQTAALETEVFRRQRHTPGEVQIAAAAPFGDELAVGVELGKPALGGLHRVGRPGYRSVTRRMEQMIRKSPFVKSA